MFAITLTTTTLAGASIGAASPEAVFDNFNLLLSGLVYSLPLMLILGVRELCNYFTAHHYQIRTTLPILFLFLLSFSIALVSVL